jgi:hypothetical protein
MKQRRWHPKGWLIMLTWKQGFGFGLWTGGSWFALRVNGVDLLLGFATLTIVPPPPKWLLNEECNPPAERAQENAG